MLITLGRGRVAITVLLTPDQWAACRQVLKTLVSHLSNSNFFWPTIIQSTTCRLQWPVDWTMRFWWCIPLTALAIALLVPYPVLIFLPNITVIWQIQFNSTCSLLNRLQVHKRALWGIKTWALTTVGWRRFSENLCCTEETITGIPGPFPGTNAYCAFSQRHYRDTQNGFQVKGGCSPKSLLRGVSKLQ